MGEGDVRESTTKRGRVEYTQPHQVFVTFNVVEYSANEFQVLKYNSFAINRLLLKKHWQLNNLLYY